MLPFCSARLETGVSKASARISGRDLKGLQSLQEDHPVARRIVVCQESEPRRDDAGIDILPAEQFSAALWADELL